MHIGHRSPHARAPTCLCLLSPGPSQPIYSVPVFSFSSEPLQYKRYKLHEILCTHFKCTVWCVLTNISSCKTITPVKIKNISSTPESFLMPAGNHRSDFCHHRFVSPVLNCHKNWFKSIIPLGLTFLIQHNICKMHPCCCMCQSFISFYCWEVFHCINIPWLVYSFTCWWTMGDFQWELLKIGLP